MKVTDRFVFFFSEKEIYSQWYPSPFEIKGVKFPTAEHYMMFAKACLFGDKITAEQILQCTSPKEAKALGRKVSPFDAEIWDKKAMSYVRQASLAKFRQNPELLKTILQHAGKEFVEASPYDKIWGVGLGQNDPRILNPKNWLGKNQLGFVLSYIAKELAAENQAY